jgi:flagellar hook-associated protein 1 FlgK
VRVASINRELDVYLQRQLRNESTGGAYADLRAQFYDRLQTIYGDPNAAISLENVYSDFTTAVQALVTNPSDSSARINALNAASVLTQRLQTLTADVQSLRGEAEQGLADTVDSANGILRSIAQLNSQLSASHTADASKADLLDQRDHYLDQLAELMDVRITMNEFNTVSVFTSSGQQLVGAEASVLSFDPQGMMTPAAHWSADETERQVGTIELLNPSGGSIDLIATRTFRSGRIKAYLEMRDEVLVQAQAQLDEFAAGLARALSDVTTQGTAAGGPNPVPAGFDLDTAGLLDGNAIKVTYRDIATSTTRTVTFVRVDHPPLPTIKNTDPNNRTVAIDWSLGLANAIAQMNAATGAQVVFSNPAGTTLRILDDGAGATSDVNAASVTKTTSSFTAGVAAMPFFMDGSNLYTGAISDGYGQSVGLAGRIAVNRALLDDPRLLVAYDGIATTPAGDQKRPQFLYDQLTAASIAYSPDTGVGTTASPFTGTLPSFLRLAMSQQGGAASSAQSLSEGQKMVVDALQQRFNDTAAVNVDQEMSNLLILQTAYGANARVFTVVKDMIDELLRIVS